MIKIKLSVLSCCMFSKYYIEEFLFKRKNTVNIKIIWKTLIQAEIYKVDLLFPMFRNRSLNTASSSAARLCGKLADFSLEGLSATGHKSSSIPLLWLCFSKLLYVSGISTDKNGNGECEEQGYVMRKLMICADETSSVYLPPCSLSQLIRHLHAS